MCPILWLYVSYRGYVWLYTTYVSKRCHNLQTMVLRGYTVKAMVIRPSSWLYDLFFSWCVSILPGKPTGGYVSPTVVIRLISSLCMVITDYILHMYRKVPEPSDGGLVWLYDQSRGYTPQFVVIRLIVLLMRQQLTMKTQKWLCVHDRGYTSHIVVMHGFTWFYTAIVPIRGVRTTQWQRDVCDTYMSNADGIV